MLKNRFFALFAVAGLVGFAACGGDEEVEVIEEPVVEEPAVAPTVEPAPAPITTDTTGMQMDTGSAMTDTTSM